MMAVLLDINTDYKDDIISTDDAEKNLLKVPCMFSYNIGVTNQQSSREKRQLIAAITLCSIFMIAELLGGYFSGSLAIMTDAAHLLSDCISFLIALIAIFVADKSPDAKMSFGYKRVEVIGALLSIFGIWALTAVLVVLAIQRLIDQSFDINADTMIIVSTMGVLMNIVTGIVLHGSCSCTSHSHSHSHFHSHSHGPMPIINKNLLMDKVKKCDEKKCERPEQLIPNYHTPSVSPYISATNSRHNSFTKMSDQRPNLENILNIARSKLQEPLRQRMSIDAGSSRNSPDPLSNNKFTYTRLSSEENIPSLLFDSTTLIPHCEPHSNPKDSNINIRAAMIHVIGDFIQSIGVLIAAIIIKFNPNLKIFDPICTFLFSLIVLMTTVKIFKDSVLILLDAVPTNVTVANLETELSCIDGVRTVHNIHVWSLTMNWNIMSAHLIVDPAADTNEILTAATTIAAKGFNINSSTFQIEKVSSTLCSE